MLAWRDAILAYALFYPAVEFLSFATIALIFWAGGLPHSARRTDAGRADRIHDVRAAILPADSGLERKIQHSAVGDGGQRTHFQAAR